MTVNVEIDQMQIAMFMPNGLYASLGIDAALLEAAVNPVEMILTTLRPRVEELVARRHEEPPA